MPTPPPIRPRPAIDFSLNGLLFIALAMFMALAAVNSQANLLFGVFGLMLGVLFISVSVSRLVLWRLRVVRVLPEHGVVGRPMTLTYEVTNDKRFWPSLGVTIAEIDGQGAFAAQPVAYVLHSPPREKISVTSEMVPRRRGLHSLETFQLSTSFPFGFVKRAALRRQKETLLVYPAIGQLDPKLLQRFQGAEKSGATLRPRRGGQDEFYGVKEFREGENPRWIHWKRTARTGVLVSKEMTLVSPPRLMLLVDTHRPGSAADDAKRVEQVIAMAGTLATHALEAGLMVGLCAWSGDWLHLAPNRGKRHSRDLMTALARLPDNRGHDAASLMDYGGNQLKTGTSVVLFTPRDVDAGRSEHARGGTIVLSPVNAAGRGAFTFEPGVSFGTA